MENIGKFLDFADQLGVPKTDIFQTVDLYEGQNIPAVSIKRPFSWELMSRCFHSDEKRS